MARVLRGVLLPGGWLEGGAREEDLDDGGEAPSVMDSLFMAEEDATLAAMFDALVVAHRAGTTHSQYRFPFLKMVYWLGVRGLPVAPPEPQDLAYYLSYILLLRRNVGCVEACVRALHYVCALNGWPKVASSGPARVPVEAAERLFGAPTRKAAPLQGWMIVQMVEHLLSSSSWAVRESPSGMFACALVAMWMCIGRYSDLCRFRYDDGYCEVHDHKVVFFADKRKNDQTYRGHYVEVARTDGGAFGGKCAYALIVEAKSVFRSGPVLRRLTKAGKAPLRLAGPWLDAPGGSPRYDDRGNRLMANMLHGDFVDWLRMLLQAIGLSAEEAAEYAGHSARRGAATSLCQDEVDPTVTKQRAGVTSVGWIAEYDEVDEGRRLAASVALEPRLS
jgi:hypothetical protein